MLKTTITRGGLVLGTWMASWPLACAATDVPRQASETSALTSAGSASVPPVLAGPLPVGREVAGVHFPPSVERDGQTLVLNGAGVRAKMIIKVYAMGLYLPRPQSDAQALLRGDQAHHIELLLLRDVDAERMRDGFGHAVLEHLSAGQADALRERVQALSQALLDHGDAHRGEALQLDYRPESGTRVTLAGQQVCPDIPGADFNQAMLAMWLGPEAADNRLKAALLGNPP